MSKKEKHVVSEIELLYLCDDDFISEVNVVRDRYGIKVDKRGVVDVESILDFDSKLRSNQSVRSDFSQDIKKLSKKFNLEDSYKEVGYLVESGVTSTTLESSPVFETGTKYYLQD